MSREKYSCYEYEVKRDEQGFIYNIFTDCVDYNFFLQTDVLRESDEWFDTEQEARFAAIEHINLLENGEG